MGEAKRMNEIILPASKYPFIERSTEGHQTQWVSISKVLAPIPVHPLIKAAR
jgi:hypothetical protein